MARSRASNALANTNPTSQTAPLPRSTPSARTAAAPRGWLSDAPLPAPRARAAPTALTQPGARADAASPSRWASARPSFRPLHRSPPAVTWSWPNGAMRSGKAARFSAHSAQVPTRTARQPKLQTAHYQISKPSVPIPLAMPSWQVEAAIKVRGAQSVRRVRCSCWESPVRRKCARRQILIASAHRGHPPMQLRRRRSSLRSRAGVLAGPCASVFPRALLPLGRCSSASPVSAASHAHAAERDVRVRMPARGRTAAVSRAATAGIALTAVGLDSSAMHRAGTSRAWMLIAWG
jgi:hypothetical protein